MWRHGRVEPQHPLDHQCDEGDVRRERTGEVAAQRNIFAVDHRGGGGEWRGWLMGERTIHFVLLPRVFFPTP